MKSTPSTLVNPVLSNFCNCVQVALKQLQSLRHEVHKLRAAEAGPGRACSQVESVAKPAGAKPQRCETSSMQGRREHAMQTSR